MDIKDKKIRELEAKIAMLTKDPRAKFYQALEAGVNYITEQLNSKRLDFENDSFAKSVLILSEKSEKVFTGLTKGLETFMPQEESGSKKGKKPSVTNEEQVSV